MQSTSCYTFFGKQCGLDQWIHVHRHCGSDASEQLQLLHPPAESDCLCFEIYLDIYHLKVLVTNYPVLTTSINNCKLTSWKCMYSIYSKSNILQWSKIPETQALVAINQFGLFLDEKHLIWCKGQINNSSLNINNKNPLLLPNKDPFIKLTFATHLILSTSHLE